MRSLLILCMAVCLALLPAVANAAGQVSDAILGQLGLSAMHQMTDTQGMDVRGSGFATVSGQSWASAPFGLAGTSQKYKAVSDPKKGSALAAGGSISVAAAGAGIFLPSGNAAGIVIGAVAGGGAVAYAK